MLRFILLHLLNHYDIYIGIYVYVCVCIYIYIYISPAQNPSFQLIVFYIISISYPSIYASFLYQHISIIPTSFPILLCLFTAQREISSEKIVSYLWTLCYTQKSLLTFVQHLEECKDNACVSACSVAQPCPTLCDPMDCSLPGSSVHWISQARILE